jgi:hypothetical protein
MAKINMNISSEEESRHAGTKGGYEPGDYSFQIVKVEDATAPSGNEGINMTFKAISGTIQFTVYDTIWLTERAKWKYVQFCHCLGLDPKAELDSDQWFGMKGGFDLHHKPGKTHLTPKKYYTPQVATDLGIDITAEANSFEADDVPF